MTAGSILSCNIITPVLRNKFAANTQKAALAKMEREKQESIQAPRGISMNDYIKNASVKYNSGSLRI